MNYPLVIKVLGYTLWVEAGCMVLPLLVVAAVMECYVTPQVMQLFM